MPFQNLVNLTPPPAVNGDFASTNPRAVVLAGPNGLIAGPQGLTIGQFAWVAADGITVDNFGIGNVAPTGFVHRDQQGLITTYLAESSLVVPAGFPVTLFDAGDFWDLLQGGTSGVVPGSALYARLSDGALLSSLPTGASATASSGATFTATGTGTALVVTAVTGLISIGDTISGTGVPTGTTIIAQPSGTAGGAGTYTTSVATTAAAVTVTSFGIVLDVTAVASGVLAVGDPISGTGIPANATIASFVSGALGGVGIYTMNIPATAYAASTTITVVAGILTKWVAKSVAAVGQLVKISTWGN